MQFCGSGLAEIVSKLIIIIIAVYDGDSGTMMPQHNRDFLSVLFETQRTLRLYADKLAVRHGITRAQGGAGQARTL